MFQMICITALEWRSLAAVLMAMLGDDKIAEAKGLTWACGMFIFLCECAGGMASVALTDAIQAGLLLFSFFMMPILCSSYYGGVAGVGYVDCMNRETAYTFGTVGAGSLSEAGQGAAGVGSPFGIYATDFGYANDAMDVSNMMASPFENIALPGDVGPQCPSDAVAAPNNFFGGGWNGDAGLETDFPEYFGQINFTFGAATALCCAMWNVTEKVCMDKLLTNGSAEFYGTCPPERSSYTGIARTEDGTWTNDPRECVEVPEAHQKLGFDPVTGRYTLISVAPHWSWYTRVAGGTSRRARSDILSRAERAVSESEIDKFCSDYDKICAGGASWPKDKCVSDMASVPEGDPYGTSAFLAPMYHEYSTCIEAFCAFVASVFVRTPFVPLQL